jgi:prepilin peptidase CpaA
VAAELLVLIVFPMLLAVAAGWDVASYTIPNLLQLALLAAFVVFVLVSGMKMPTIEWHLLAALLALGIGVALFARGFVGGGDAKLFAAVVLWLGLHDMAVYALVASAIGGVLTLALMGLRLMPMPAALTHQAWLTRLHSGTAGFPYGVALAAGALIILPHSEIFRLAAG